MMKLQKADERGVSRLDWLDTRFSAEASGLFPAQGRCADGAARPGDGLAIGSEMGADVSAEASADFLLFHLTS